MNKDTFETLKTTLEKRIAVCNEKLGFILTTEDLKNLTLGEAQALKSWAKTEQGKMDKIIGVDLYHIIGMGELSAVQTNLFLKLIKEYMSFRSDIKTIAMNLTIDNIPGLPSESEYKLSLFGGIKLKSKVRDTSLEAASTIKEN